MSRWKPALVIIALAILALLGWRLLHKPQAVAQAADAPIPVTAVGVEQRNVPVYLNALGTVQALNTVTVRPQVGGQLMALGFVEGQEVKKGDVIARIDPRTYQATLDQARAKQKQDEAQVSASRSTLRRYEDLIKQHFVAAQDVENQRQTVSQQESLIAADAAAVESARIQLDYTTVRAPIDGLTGIRMVDVGNIVQANDATGIVTLTQTHPITVLFTLPEQNLELVRDYARGDDRLRVIAMDRVDSHVVADDGTLSVIDNQIDTTTGTFRLKSQFPNEKNDLWPGQFVNVRLKVNTVQGGLVIPTQAVQRGPDGDYVYVVVAAEAAPAAETAPSPTPTTGKSGKGGGRRAAAAAATGQTVRMQPIKVGGEADDSHVLVISGLADGDQVVTEGQFRLKPGARVTALKPGEAAPPPSEEELSAAKQSRGGGRRGR